ncbi:MAG: adenylate/guanylate cyclase domain-containing protein [Betaproteobacteria bacterium]|nr:adenylate/guanylate cyclase domain-containing protein [Betaproteobacteria bacterium]
MFKRTLVAAILTAGAVLALSGVFEPLDARFRDFQFSMLRSLSPQPAARDVVIVGVDEETIRRLPEPVTLWHRHLGRFFSAMAAVQPAAVGVDIVLPDRSFEAVLPGSDKLLMMGLLQARRAYPVVLALTVDPAGKPRPVYPPYLALAGSGYALFPLDRDGHVRRYDEQLPGAAQPLPLLAGQMARAMKIEPGKGYIDFWRGTPFDYVPFHQVLQWSEEGNEKALAQAFRGQPVLVGMVLRYEDRLRVPVPMAAREEPEAVDAPGVMLHAQALRNMLGAGFIQAVPAPVTMTMIATAGLLWFVAGGAVFVAALFVAFALGLIAASTWLVTQGHFLPVAAILLTALIALGGRHARDTWEHLRERRRLRASFAGYVSPGVMQEILAGRIQPELGGTKQFVCVMFSDIRNYTTRSEAMTPEQVIRFLNRYFEEVVGRIHERGGSVTSFIGDGIMAVFGSPNSLASPCDQAFESAREMLQYVARLNAQLTAEGEVPLEIGIGLHAGEAVVGHVGSASRHDYTAIGDVINVAARIEGLSKEAGFRLICSRVVTERLSAGVTLVALGPMAIKGHTPVEVYGFDKV